MSWTNKELFKHAKNTCMILQISNKAKQSDTCKIVRFQPVYTYTYNGIEYDSEFELFDNGLAYFYREMGAYRRYSIESSKGYVR